MTIFNIGLAKSVMIRNSVFCSLISMLVQIGNLILWFTFLYKIKSLDVLVINDKK